MVTLNDYLYSGDTVLRIIQKYSKALKESSIETGNTVGIFHSFEHLSRFQNDILY